jgi:glycosyltransferase involved in cell wall biosynthesis
MISNKPKVLFYFDSPFYSGAEMQAVRNAKALVGDGTDVTICFRNSGNLGETLMQKVIGTSVSFVEFPAPSNRGGVLRRIVNNRILFLLVLVWARGVLRQSDFDVIHINNGGYPGATGARAFALASLIYSKNARIVFTVNNLAVPFNSLGRLLQFPVDKILACSKIAWVTASHAASSRLSKVLGLNGKSSSVIPNGIGTITCTCSSESEIFELPVKLQDLVVCQIGHLEQRKGQRVLIDAVNILKEQARLPLNWRFFIEGSGPMLFELSELIKKYALSQQVSLVGRVSCIYHLLDRSDVLVHPSVSNEDLPNVISEAMSMGLPVIGSDVGGIKEQISHMSTGVVLEPGDSLGFSEAIHLVLSDSEFRAKLAKEGFSKYESRFTEERAIEKYRRLYFNKE